MQLAAVNGFGLSEPAPDPRPIRLHCWPATAVTWCEKSVDPRNQIHDELDAVMPGYSGCRRHLRARIRRGSRDVGLSDGDPRSGLRGLTAGPTQSATTADPEADPGLG